MPTPSIESRTGPEPESDFNPLPRVPTSPTRQDRGIATLLLTCLLWLLVSVSARGASITGFVPDRGGAGTEVVLTGSGLQTTLFVYFGSTEATGEILSRNVNSVRVRVPPNAVTGQLSVFTTGSGSASSLALFIAAPRVESFTPLSGAPGSLVTLSGFNFGTGQFGSRGNVTSVLFNGQRAQFEIAGINQILALVPTNASTGPITLANEAGSVSTIVPFQVAALISGLSSTNGTPGDAIEIRGANLGTALKVEFGLERADYTIVSPALIVARVPTNAINARLQVTTPAGAVATPYSFVVGPRIVRFLPEFGAPGTNVVLEGGGFHGVTGVEFSSLRAAFTYQSSTRVETIVPSGAVSGPIRIITTNGTFTSTTHFHLPPRVTVFNPNSGRRGDVITLDGQNLSGVTRVLFNGAEAEFNVVSLTRITAVVPAAATPGQITVETPAGEIRSSGTFNVIPLLDGFAPSSASAGSVVSLSGSGLTNITWVRLGDLEMSFTLLNPTAIRAIVPLNAFSGPIRARNVNGVEFAAPGTFFVDGARPSVSTFTPAEGGTGTRVQIQGQGFRTTSRVQFNGVNAVFTVTSPTSLEATVPIGATRGVIAVTTLDGIAASDSPFNVRETPVSLLVGRGIASDEIALRWTTNAIGYVLESSGNLKTGGSWSTVTRPPTVDGPYYRVILPATLPDEVSFFRLRK